MAMAYWCLLIGQTKFTDAVALLPAILLWIFASASVGHFLNDWFDIEIDSKAGKQNFTGKLSSAQRIMVLCILLVFLLVPPVFFRSGPAVQLLTFIQLLLFVLYSHPYFRWKEKLWLGVFADCLYAFVLPVSVIIFYCGVEEKVESVLWIALCLWLVAAGVRNILLHQLADVVADKQTGIITLPVLWGKAFVYKIINRMLLPIEIISAFIFIKETNLLSVPVYASVLLAWLLIKASIMRRELKTEAVWQSTNHPSFAFLNNFYEQVLPLLFLVQLLEQHPAFVFLFFLHLFLFWKPMMDFMKTGKGFFRIFLKHE